MPTYEYLCKTCSHRFETWQKMTDEPLTTCPECGAHIRRVLFPTGVVFKGSGFYKTDHRDSASAAASAKDDGQPTEGAKTEAPAASESKTAESSASSTADTTTSGSKTAASTSTV